MLEFAQFGNVFNRQSHAANMSLTEAMTANINFVSSSPASNGINYLKNILCYKASFCGVLNVKGENYALSIGFGLGHFDSFYE